MSILILVTIIIMIIMNSYRRFQEVPSADIMDFRGFDSSIILIIRGGTLMSIGNYWGPKKRESQVTTGLIAFHSSLCMVKPSC